MTIYIIFYIALLIYTFACPRNKIVLSLFCVTFCLLVGMRGIDVGTDTHIYIQIYHRNGIFGYNGYPEFIYGWIGWLMFQLGLNFSESQTLLMFLTLSPVFFVFKYRSSYPALSVFTLFSLYFLFYAMNITRQAMSCFILLPAYYFFVENQGMRRSLLPFSILVIIASGFHITALTAFLIPFVVKLNLNSSRVLLGFLLSLVMGLLLSNDMLGSLIGEYSGYINSDVGTRTETRTIMSVFLCVYWIFLFCFTYFQASKELRSSTYMKIFWYSILINNILVKQELGIRVTLLYSIVQTLIYPMLVRDCKKNAALIQFTLIILLSIFLFIFLLNNSAMIVPYTTLDNFYKSYTTI